MLYLDLITLNHCLTKKSVGIAAVNYFSKSESIDVNIPVFAVNTYVFYPQDS